MSNTTRADEQALAEGCYIDDVAGDKACTFFRSYLSLSSGRFANKPFNLLPWQERDIVRPLFSWKRPDGKRRFSRCLITKGKKNGASALVAGIALYLLLADGEDSPLVVLGATAREQASELFREILFSVRNNQKLRDVTHVIPSQKTLTYPKKNGTLKAISWDSPSKGGWNCSAVILDEMSLHYDARLYEMLKSSMVAREQPLLVMVSNAGYDKNHFYYGLYQSAKAILNGDSTDTTFLPVVYELPEDVDWKDETKWHLANPSLGTVLSPASFREDFEDAQKGRAGELHFRRMRLNQWTAKRDNNFLDLDQWDACKGTFPSLVDKDCYLAFDLSSTVDLTSIAAVYPMDGKFYVKSYNFVPRAATDRQNKMNLKSYLDFGNDLTVLDGNCIDYERVLTCVRTIPGRVKSIAFDKWNALAVAQSLQRERYDLLNFPQTNAYFNEPVKKLQELVLDRRIVHDGNTCLRWCVNNTQLQQDNKGLLKPVKAAEQSKIDSVVALLMALSQAILHDASKPAQSVYDTRGVSSI